MIGELISGGLQLLGGHLNRQSNERSQQLVLEDKEKDRALQREFAQSGIQWRVADAAKAGIHPLYALGGTGSSYSPSAISLSPDNSMGTAVASMGQDISRAINATRTTEQRADAFSETMKQLQLQRGSLENELLGAQIAKLKASANPPMPAPGSKEILAGTDVVVPRADKFEDRPRLALGSGEFRTDTGVTNAEDFEKRYGEITDMTFGPYIAWRDYLKNVQHPDFFQSAARKIGKGLAAKKMIADPHSYYNRARRAYGIR